MSTTKRKAGSRKTEAAPTKKAKEKEPAKAPPKRGRTATATAKAAPKAAAAPGSGGGGGGAKKTVNADAQLALPLAELKKARKVTRDGLRGDVAGLLDVGRRVLHIKD